MNKYDYIRDALDKMASRCDGASSKDDVGFNGPDAQIVRSLLGFCNWSEKQARLALKILGTYKNTQLPELGVDLEELWRLYHAESEIAELDTVNMIESEPTEESNVKPAQIYRMFIWSAPKPIVTRQDKMLMLMTTEPDQKFWGMWKSAKQSMKAAGVSVKSDAGTWKVNWWCEPDVYYGLNALNGRRPKIDTTGLLEYQHPHVANLVAALKHFDGAVLDGSGTGCGKTVSAIVAGRNLKMPLFVVCPATLPPTWKYWSALVGHPVIDARGYEELKCGNTPFVKKVSGSFVWNLPKNTLVVFDEVHRAGGMKNEPTGKTPINRLKVAVKFKNKQNAYLKSHPQASVSVAVRKVKSRIYNLNLHDFVCVIADSEKHAVSLKQIADEIPIKNDKRWTLESELLDSATKQGFKTLMLSATVADSSKRMSAVGAAMGLFPQRNDFYNWSRGYGCGFKEIYVHGGKKRTILDWQCGTEVMQNLHRCIYGTGRGFRMRPEEIEGFPDGQIEARLLDLEECREVYESVRAAIDAAHDDGKHHLADRTAVRQAAELAKVDESVSMGRDLLDEECSPVFFVNFRATLHELEKSFKGCSVVHGDQSIEERTESLRRFQANESQVMIATYGAGGTGADMHDLHGRRRICIGVSVPEWSLQLVQSLGRTRRTGAVSPSLFILLFADCWPERDIWENVRSKALNIGALNDGDLAMTI